MILSKEQEGREVSHAIVLEKATTHYTQSKKLPEYHLVNKTVKETTVMDRTSKCHVPILRLVPRLPGRKPKQNNVGRKSIVCTEGSLLVGRPDVSHLGLIIVHSNGEGVRHSKTIRRSRMSVTISM